MQAKRTEAVSNFFEVQLCRVTKGSAIAVTGGYSTSEIVCILHSSNLCCIGVILVVHLRSEYSYSAISAISANSAISAISAIPAISAISAIPAIPANRVIC